MLRNRSAAGIIAFMLSLIWALFIFLDYLVHHPDLSRAITDPPYAGILIFFGLVAGGSAWWTAKKLKAAKGNAFTSAYRGLGLYGLLQLIAIIILTAFVSKTGLDDPGMAIRIPYFLVVSTAYLGGVILLLTLTFVIGNWLFRPLQTHYAKADYTLISMALGFGGLAFISTILGLFGFLSIWVCMPLFLVLLGVNWRAGLDFLKQVIWQRHELNIQRAWTPPVILFLLVVLAVNWIGAFKLFPIGYDGGSLYVNLAELTAQSGALPAGGQAYAWSVVMSLGEVLFSSRTLVILLANGMGFLLLFALYRLSRRWLSPAYARLAVLLTASLPYFGFQALVEEKVDFALSYVLLCLFLLVLPDFRSWRGEGDQKAVVSFKGLSLPSADYGFLLAGCLAGFAFSIKYTAILFVLALGCYLLYRYGRRLAFFGGALLSLALVFGGGLYRFGYLEFASSSTPLLLGLLSAIGGLGLLWLAFRADREAGVLYFRGSAFLLVSFVLAFLPWSIKHLSENDGLSLSHLLEGRSAQPEINQTAPWSMLFPMGSEQDSGFGRLTQDSDLRKSELSVPAAWETHLTYQSSQPFGSTGDARYEELQRYLGYEQGLGLYTSLPYDVTMNTNISGSRYVEVGFLFLLFFPLLLFLGLPTTKRMLTVALPAFLLALIWLAFSTISVYAPDGNWDATAANERLQALFAAQPNGETSILHGLYHIFWSVISGLASALAPLYRAGTELSLVGSLLVMLGLATGVYFLLRPRLNRMDGDFKALGGFTFVYLFLWWLLGNGILWYAMPVFILLPVLILRYLERPAELETEKLANSGRRLLGTLVSLALLLNVMYYFTSSFPTDREQQQGIFRWPFVEYVTNPSASEADIYEHFNPVLDDVVRTLNTDQEARVYRVNTFYGFLIDNNDKRVFSDPTLDKFDDLSARLQDQSGFFDLLKQEGFRYILLDLRMHMTDQTPEKTLTAKYIRLAELLLRSDKVRLLHTDNYIADPNGQSIRLPDGSTTQARQGLAGRTVSLGTMALFEIP